MKTQFQFLRASVFLMLVSFASTAFSVMINSETGYASLDGTWAFPGCSEPDTDEGELYDQMEYLVFSGDTVESRVVEYDSDDGSCSGPEINTESETFDFMVANLDLPSSGWVEIDENDNEVPADAPPCQNPAICTGNNGLLSDPPLVTELEILIPGDPGAEDPEDREDSVEIGYWYIDDTGGDNPEQPWKLWRNAGEDDDPSTSMSVEEPLTRLAPESVSISIDIKPGSDPNSVNPRSKGVIPVAALGSMDFDALQIDVSTVEFGPGGASPAHDGHVEDVNEDGYMDMVFHFGTQESGIVCGDTEATLTAETFDGMPVSGIDSVNAVGCKAKSDTAAANAAIPGGDSSGLTTGAGAMDWLLVAGLGFIGLRRLKRAFA